MLSRLGPSRAPSDSRPASGPAAPLDAEIRALAAKIDGLAARMADQLAESRRRLASSDVEIAWGLSETQLTPKPCTVGTFRVVSFLVYTPNAGTLQLKGSAGRPTLRIPVPTGITTQMVGGDSYGGIYLDFTDVRTLTNGGAAGEMLIVISGERMGDAFRY